jgi:RNA polymerase sigma factor (sigma-70 family)
MKKVFLAVCAALASVAVMAQTEDKPWSVGVYGGKVEAANDWGNKFMHVTDGFYGAASFTFSRYLNNHFDAELHALWGRYGTQGGDFFATDGEYKAGMGYVDLTGKFKFIPSDRETLLNPFAFVSLGARAIYGLDDATDFITPSEDEKGVNFVIGAGLGCDMRVSDVWGIRYFCKYGFPIGPTADKNDTRECGKFNDQHLIHNLGVYFNFAFNTDKDKDGVPNKLDQCPETPAGVAVDDKGCPLDNDGDKVPDYLDQCANTPAGVEVDSVGCPIDTDKDGNTMTLIDIIDDGVDIHEQVDLKIRSKQLYSFLGKCLDKRELEIIVYRYGLYSGFPHTQNETAKKLGISRSYVSRIEKKALEKLREMYET